MGKTLMLKEESRKIRELQGNEKSTNSHILQGLMSPKSRTTAQSSLQKNRIRAFKVPKSSS